MNGNVVAKGHGRLDNFLVPDPAWDPGRRLLGIGITVISDSATMAISRPEAKDILDTIANGYALVIHRERGRVPDVLDSLIVSHGGPSPEAPPARPPTLQEAPPPAARERTSRPPKSTATTTPRVEAPRTPTTAPAPKAQGPSPTPPAPVRSVASMSAGEKLAEAALRAGQQLGPEFVEQLKGLFSFETLVVLVVWAASHAVGLGEALDAILAAIFGVDVAKEFVSFVFTAIDAKSDKDLDKAGHHLAAVVIAVGLPKLGKLLGEVGGKALKGGSEAERTTGKTGTAGREKPVEVEGEAATDASKAAKKAVGVLKGELDATTDRLLKRHGFTYDPATGVATSEATKATAFRNREGLWIYNEGSNTVTEHAVVARYGDVVGTADFFQGHHPIQDHWAEIRLTEFGYKSSDEPAILLRDRYKDSPHQIISARQGTRKADVSKRTYAQERLEALEDLRQANVPKATRDRIMAAADDYFRRIMTNIKDPAAREAIFGDFK